MEQNITKIKGIGAKRKEELERLGIYTIEDMLYYFPFRYEQRILIETADELEEGQAVTIFGTVASASRAYVSGKVMVRAKVRCADFNITLIWFNQPYVMQNLHSGMLIMAHGHYHKNKERQLAVSSYKKVASREECEAYLGIIPVYRATEGINSAFVEKTIQTAIDQFLPQMEEILPADLCKRHHLIPRREAIVILHRPKDWKELNIARYRMVAEEFIALLLLLQTGENRKEPGLAQGSDTALTQQFLQNLPFRLTDAQRKVILEIKRDMESPYQMYRLLQGDVGSGKTIVAIFALIKTIEAGYQGALMAPTEILAKQHYRNVEQHMAPLGIKTALLVGSLTRKEKEEIYRKLETGEIQVVVGTHALIQEEVEFQHLGLAVIDEQHRFGVKQQLQLHKKGTPDILVMTATPIPRSLALTLYGDLDLSVIDELPKGRKPIITWHISKNKRDKMYQFVHQELSKGHQAYVVCPLIEESEKVDLTNVYELAEELKQKFFGDISLEILHGRMKDEEKEAVMERFRTNQTQVLVATTVIEVGVDVANATVMVIENAQRFGLAQLHQLRGRVGRGSEQSYCILLSDGQGDETKRRMQAMTSTNDGFLIAEEDLSIRGPGEVLGLRQHGLPDLRIANLAEDIQLLERAKACVEEIYREGLQQEKYAPLRAYLLRIKEQRMRGERNG